MKNIILHIFTPICLSVIGEFLLKFSVRGQSFGFNISAVVSVITNGGILIGVGLILCGALLWIIGMSKFQLSYMYPFMSLNYVLVILGSDFILKENVQMSRYIALGLIVIGLCIISRSPHMKIKE